MSRIGSLCDRMEGLGTGQHQEEAVGLVRSARNCIKAAKARLAILRQ